LVRIALKSVALSLVFREPFAVGGGVVGDRDLLGLELVRNVGGDGGTLLVIAPDRAEHDLEALFGQLRIGRRAGNHRNPGLVVDRRRGDRDTRV
jgi:hypothetical protein